MEDKRVGCLQAKNFCENFYKPPFLRRIASRGRNCDEKAAALQTRLTRATKQEGDSVSGGRFELPKTRGLEDKRGGCLCEQAAQLRHSEPYYCQAESETLEVPGEESPCIKSGILRVKNNCHPQNDVMVHEPIKFIYKRRGKFALSKFEKILLTYLPTYLLTPVKNLVPYYPGALVSSKKAAFTLAEVLITLGIIGVVAAMTMPALVGKYKEKVLITQAKKTLSIITNALNMAKAKEYASDYGDIFRSENTSNETADIIFKNLQVVERCLSGNHGCGGSYTIKQQYRTNDGFGNVKGGNSINSYSRAVLKDGSIIGISQTKYPGSSCSNIYKTYDKDEDGNFILDSDGNKTGERDVNEIDCGHIVFDTNGKKGPNQYGQDVFLIYIIPNGKGYKQRTGLIDNVFKNNKLEYENFEEGGRF